MATKKKAPPRLKDIKRLAAKAAKPSAKKAAKKAASKPAKKAAKKKAAKKKATFEQHVAESSADYLVLLEIVFTAMADNGYDFGVEEEVAEVCIKHLKWDWKKYVGHMKRLHGLVEVGAGFSWEATPVNGEPVTQIYYDGGAEECEKMHAKVRAALMDALGVDSWTQVANGAARRSWMAAKKTAKKTAAAPCSRCGGKGRIERFGHVANGVCFKCEGTGLDGDAPDLTVAPPPEGGHPTREAWLEAAVDGLRPLFESVGAPLPQVRVSVGWARGSRKATGQCWDASSTEDGVAQIFISPSLVDLVGTPIEDEKVIKAGVLDVLLHECVHAAIGNKEKHGPVFRKTAHAVGLGGKMTATRPTGACCVRLSALAETLGPWPHAKITASPAKQSTRMIKVVCADPECECGGYAVRTTSKWLDVGVPTCPFGGEMEVAS